MRDYALTADVPLGPFEGTAITAYSARGKNAKLHASASCTLLRTSDVVTAQVPLNAAMVHRMCTRCAEWGSWARPTTGLGVFLKSLGGSGLLYQLRSYTAPDDDDEDERWDGAELAAAVELLRPRPEGADDEVEVAPGGRDAREDAERLRDLVFSTWRGAATSLHRAQVTAAGFPWLEQWAEPKLALKRQYLEALRTQAARFVDPDGLLAAAAVVDMNDPELPVDDDAFAVLGKSHEITSGLKELWSKWRVKAASGWDDPRRRSYIAYSLTHRIRSNRKGYEQALVGARALVDSWEEQARAVAGADSGPARLLTLHLPEIRNDSARRGDGGFLDALSPWTIGVLVTCLTDADWGRRTVTLRAPALIADRLTADGGVVAVETHAEGKDRSAAPGTMRRPSCLQPGVFDDTPVFGRHPVTKDHLRALHEALPHADRFYIVFSPSGGVETLPLAVVEARLAQGWQGAVVAGVSDLPVGVIEPWVAEIGPRPSSEGSIWPEPVHDVHDARFGAELGLAAGAQRAAWLPYDDRDRERSLRLLAMARGVPDLRTLDSGHDHDGRARTLPHAVWQGLLSDGQLDLEPFEQPTEDRWTGGSGIPLGVLADVQVYAVNADPRYEGKGHSPLCRHSRERGVAEGDDLLTVSDLVVRDDFDWCGKCGGYAVRRLTDTQLSYYRAAHRLHDIAQQLDRGRDGCDRVDAGVLGDRLSELADWHPIGEESWYTAASRRWRRIVHDLRTKAEEAHCHGTR
ncbi:hypothetical protein AB0G74_08825 [Streptomyces sp. NPDC020875]|uniref:hypothetical protein n=1 Tax=Streptomyces sp. NPDC020875 TaxID=3154898 RepID=UPI003402A879